MKFVSYRKFSILKFWYDIPKIQYGMGMYFCYTNFLGTIYDLNFDIPYRTIPIQATI